MNVSPIFLNYFETLKDPRSQDRNYQHDLTDILVITILGVICGADTWEEIANFGLAKYEWLKSFLSLPNGIPSHDTFGRVFALLDPAHFEACFRSWIASLQVDLEGEVIAIDGKTLRGSGSRNKKKPKALHLVSAWASENRLMLGQVQTEEKSNEIEAIPRLLQMLDIEGSIVTIDAMGCQRTIAEQILDQRGASSDPILEVWREKGRRFLSITRNPPRATKLRPSRKTPTSHSHSQPPHASAQSGENENG